MEKKNEDRGDCTTPLVDMKNISHTNLLFPFVHRISIAHRQLPWGAGRIHQHHKRVVRGVFFHCPHLQIVLILALDVLVMMNIAFNLAKNSDLSVLRFIKLSIKSKFAIWLE